MNTTPWRRIRVAPTALWHSVTRLAPAGRFQADWAVRLTDEALDAERGISAMPLAELLARAGWSHADMVVCDAAGSEREVFADPLAPWLRRLDVALVRCYDQLAPQAGAVVASCFPDDVFTHRSHGGFELFERRAPLTTLPPLPEERSLLRAAPGGAPFRLHQVPQFGWGFFIFDGSSCQLHPNPPGEPPSQASFPVVLDGYTRFTSGLAHAGNPGAAAVRFTARVQWEDGTVLAEAAVVVPARGAERLTIALPEGMRGAALVVLETGLAPGLTDNRMAWARFIDPKLS